jgi:hypothetical protein
MCDSDARPVNSNASARRNINVDSMLRFPLRGMRPNRVQVSQALLGHFHVRFDRTPVAQRYAEHIGWFAWADGTFYPRL